MFRFPILNSNICPAKAGITRKMTAITSFHIAKGQNNKIIGTTTATASNMLIVFFTLLSSLAKC